MARRLIAASWVLAFGSSFALGCDAPVTGEDAAIDSGGGELDAGLRDAGMDASPPVEEDAGPPDAGTRDAFVPRPDARVDADPEAARAYLDAVCGALGRAFCTVPWACGCETTPVPDPLECIPERTGACEARYLDLPATLAMDGLHAIDRPMVDACRDTLRASYDACLAPPPLEDLYACVHMMRSSLPLGEFCTTGGLCADGAGFCRAGQRCAAIPSTDGAHCASRCGEALACVSGQCRAPLAEGETCGDDEDCAAPHRCIGGVCGVPGGAGAACSADERCALGHECDGGTCRPIADLSCDRASGVCGAGLECVALRDSRCFPRRPVGATCSGDEFCTPDAFCDFSLFVPVCAAKLARDQRCSSGSGCQDGLVCDFLPDRGDSFCTDPAPLGASCDGRTCAAGTVCIGLVCSPIPDIGEHCEGECLPGGYCDWLSNTCAYAGNEGELCDDGSSSRECVPGTYCSYDGSGLGTCRRVPVDGERCEDAGFCVEPAVCAYFDGPMILECVGPAGDGEICFGSCASADSYCGDDLDHGTCLPRICSELGRGGREDPPPIPL